MNDLSLAIRQFNEKVRNMNQTHAKQLVLTANEAQSLHTDIFSLLANFAELSSKGTEPEVTQVAMDGGRF